MGDTQIIVGSYTFTFQPSDIDDIEETVTSDIQNIKIAGSSPMANYNYDYSGTAKVITITGKLHEASSTRVSGYTVTTILAQKQWLESVINGSQGIIELNDDFAGQTALTKSGATPPYLTAFTSTKSMAASIKFRRVAGKPNELPYTLVMLVGQ